MHHKSRNCKGDEEWYVVADIRKKQSTDDMGTATPRALSAKQSQSVTLADRRPTERRKGREREGERERAVTRKERHYR